ncbi:hypothetical protein, partial [Clostridioides difficile]|uniref:hypothetical protein n=1 Tax=Clostridioides difficile TaxID=1496 RepID=UPI001A9B386B
LEQLVIGIANCFEVFVDEAFMNARHHRHKLYIGIEVIENTVQSFQLPGLFGKNVYAEPGRLMRFEITDEQIELPVERR